MTKYHSRGPDLNMDECVENSGGNRFDLVLMASARAREIRRQHASSDKFEHTHPVVTALKDFQDKKIGAEYFKNTASKLK